MNEPDDNRPLKVKMYETNFFKALRLQKELNRRNYVIEYYREVVGRLRNGQQPTPRGN